MGSRHDAFLAGAAAVAPMLPGVAPFGIVAGLTAVATGLDTAQALAMSLVIFAGASQLATLQLVAADAVPVVILMTVCTINLRFAMYSASLAPYFQHLGRGWRFALAYVLVDQNYALSINRFVHGPGSACGHWFYLGAGSLLWLTWQASTAVGVLMGGRVPRDWSLDFAIPLVFMVLLVPSLRDRPHLVAAVVGGTVATVAASAPMHLGLLIGALSGICAGTVAETRLGRGGRA